MAAASEKTGGSPAVPAARRALLVLEHLAGSPRSLTLSELSRALAVSPSSMLALLATLRGHGYVDRGDDDRYRVGSALVALGAAAATQLDPGEAFRGAAAALHQSLGDTVLLWRVDGDEAVLVGAREGWRDLRVVPRLGQRIRLAGSALAQALAGAAGRAVAVGELEPGTAVAAVAVARDAVLAVAGPAARVHRPDVEAALREAAAPLARIHLDTPGSAPGASPGALAAAELRAFLAEPLLAVLAYRNEAGYPATVPVWFHWDGWAFWLLPGPRARWVAQVRSDPRVSLTVGEAGPPLRRVNAEGAASVLHDGRRARRVQVALARKYAAAGGADPAWRWEPGELVRVVPTRLTSWRGLPGRADHAGAPADIARRSTP